MPIYEYRCAKCGDFDVMQKITEKPLQKCPTCKRKVSKLVSNTAFQLKGTGWYVTDYAGKGKSGGSSESKDTGSAADSGSTESKASESKTPDAKDASKKGKSPKPSEAA
jgi:putative FmdB family regulatory protein